jgi:hypothetical protein
VDINKAPNFVGSAVIASGRGPRTYTGWATGITVGANADGTPAVKEQGVQTMTFTVSVTPESATSLFSVQPRVSLQGTLTFTLSSGVTGRGNLIVELRDNGGNLYGGVSTSGQKSFLLVVDPVTKGNVAFASNWKILQGAQLQRMIGFVRVTPSSLLSDVSYSIDVQPLSAPPTASDAVKRAYFTQYPSIDTLGTLEFEMVPAMHGAVLFQVTVVETDASTGAVINTVRGNTTLTVTPVNTAPSFTLNKVLVTVTEGTNPALGVHTIPNFVSSVKAYTGTQKPAGPSGEDWGEDSQQLSFLVSGSSSWLATQPAVDPSTGALTFSLKPEGSGSQQFTLRLFDNGGRLDGGEDASSEASFTIRVVQVNDPPSFSVNCFPTLAVQEQVNCSRACLSGNLSGCTVKISVGENCVDCGPVGDTCATGMIVPGLLTKIMPSYRDTEDERSQKVSFFVDVVSQSTAPGGALFTALGVPTINAMTGDLSLCLNENIHGTATLNVWAKDNAGGNSTSQNLTLVVEVLVVNQRPSLTICPSASTCVEQSCCSGTSQQGTNPNTAEQPAIVVWQNSGAIVLKNFVSSSRGRLDAGEVDTEAHQNVTVTIAPIATVPSGASLFAAAPQVDSNGTLRFQLAVGSSGFAVLRATVQDDGYAGVCTKHLERRKNLCMFFMRGICYVI